ncbi:PQQ-like beta-propeller repeat protein [Treponema sp. TIM-1]|uniref:WD40 repeat domain-containing protein n=1 Tax=Treponema sp. TIM-1 TaxID=2898417 RepID=UPI00397EC50A
MVKKKQKYWIIAVFLLFMFYAFIAGRPIPVETILTSQWLRSLESDYPDFEDTGPLIPFELGGRFGYVDSQGNFALNRIKGGYVSLSKDRWAEYQAMPESIEVRDPLNSRIVTIKNSRGYPKFLDNRVFIINYEQTSLSLVDESGTVQWTHDFAAPLTYMDAAAGLIVTGSLDGTVELLDGNGRLVFPPFEPGGSRYSVILGCRISRDGSKLAMVSGIDPQRFLLLGRFGDSYKVIYHEFLPQGFRREVHIAFIDNDNRVVFERNGGLGVYTIQTRKSLFLPLDGDIHAIDGSGDDGLLFVITSESEFRKNLVVIRLPETKIIEAPFISQAVFLGRQDSRVFIGGGTTMVSFELDKK